MKLLNWTGNYTNRKRNPLKLIKKIADSKDNRCKHPSHNPPMHRYYPPGQHEYKCPVCGYITKFEVPEITL